MTPTTTDPLTRALQQLDAAGVTYEVVQHTATYTAEDEARAAGRDAPETAKTLVLTDRDRTRLAVIPAGRRLDIERARVALGATGALRLATEHEIARRFPGYEVGALPPFAGDALAEAIDSRLLARDRILCAAGDHRHAVLLNPRDLLRFGSPRVADLCRHAPAEHRFTELPEI